MTTAPQPFDTTRHLRFRNRAAARFHEYDFLKTRVSSALADRLADSARRFEQVLDLGSHSGQLAAALIEGGQVDQVTCFDGAQAMISGTPDGAVSITGDPEVLPFEQRQFDLVASALSLHWINDLPGQLVQIREVLKPDGLFLAGLFGAGTLSELRESLMQAETELIGGAAPRVSPLPGLQDCAGLLQRAGFAMPVADIDHVTVRYDTVFHLMRDLRGMGEQAAFAAGGWPLSRRIVTRAAEIYAERFADSDGRVRASFEIVYLSGWRPAPNQPQPKRPGSARASLAEALGAKEQSAGEKANSRKR